MGTEAVHRWRKTVQKHRQPGQSKQCGSERRTQTQMAPKRTRILRLVDAGSPSANHPGEPTSAMKLSKRYGRSAVKTQCSQVLSGWWLARGHRAEEAARHRGYYTLSYERRAATIS